MRRAARTVVLTTMVLASLMPTSNATASTLQVNAHRSNPGGTSLPHFMKGGGPFKHPAPHATDHDQFGAPKIPVGPYHPRPTTRPISFYSPLRAGPQRASTGTGSLEMALPSIMRNTAQVAPARGDPQEPTTAAYGNVVVYTDNTQVAFSVNGGSSFTSFSPGSMYSDDPEGGTCCDQDVIYVPQIKEFAWLVQYWAGPTGADLDRLAVFPPSAVTSSGLTSWTYWDIYASMLPGTDPFLDFPDLAFGNSYLYVTADAGSNGHVYQTLIARIGLTNLEDGLNLAAGPEAWRYIDGSLFFGKVVQDTGSVAYWASNTSTSSMGASEWPESSTSWSGPYNVPDYSWPNSNYTSNDPSGQAWMHLYQGTVLGSVRIGDDLYFAWTAGIGSGTLSWLSQPHVELAETTTSFKFVGQRAIWNPGFAFAYPNLATSEGDLGISFAYGGGRYYASSAVGDLTQSPYVVDSIAQSTADCGCGRWGDYYAIRPSYANPDIRSFGQWVASGYAWDNAASTKSQGWDDHYVVFNG
jgi:hypothetical protein